MRSRWLLFLLFGFLTPSAITCADCPPECTRCLMNTLDCNEKRLEKVPGLPCNPDSVRYPQLTTLLLVGNTIQLHNRAFCAFPKAQAIDLSDNKVNEIDEGAFSDLLELKELNLASNSIRFLSSLNLPTVSKLELSHNPIQSVDNSGPTSPNLEELALSECKLSTFTKAMLSNMPRLVSLDLSRNSLLELDLAWFEVTSSLTTLNMSHNQVQSVKHPAALTLRSLRVLDLSYNAALKQLTSDALKKQLPALQTLLLQHTALLVPDAGPLLSHGTIADLSLAGCSIRQLRAQALSELPALRRLDLSANMLRDVEGTFDSTTTLEVVHLSRNYLTAVTAGIFSRTPKLIELYLNENIQLETFNLPAIENLEYLRVLDISDTALVCDCRDDYWLLELWSNETLTKFSDSCGNNPKCEWEDSNATQPWWKCWEPPYCPAGEKCCADGDCKQKCAGAAISALPLAALLLLGVLVMQLGSEHGGAR